MFHGPQLRRRGGDDGTPVVPVPTPDFLWQMDEATGTRVAALGGRNLLEVGGAVASTPGIDGNAARFTVAAGTRLEDAAFGAPGIRTISCWYRPQGPATYSGTLPLICGALNLAAPGADMNLRESVNRTQILCYNSVEPSTFTLNQVIGTWYYLFGVLQDTGGGNVGPNLSVNGSAFQPPDFGGALPLSLTQSAWKVGDAIGGANAHVEGDVDQIALWTSAQPLSVGQAIYNGGAGRPLP